MMSIVNAVIDGLSSAAKAVVSLLSAFSVQTYMTYSIDNQYLRWLNWLVPVGQMMVVLQAWLVAISVWYVYRIILRWAKAIQ